jgi:SNF2 family DNA or RNA helicase
MLQREGNISELVAPNALSLLMRLSQIAGGYVPFGDKVLPCDTTNPKITIIKELVDDIIESGHQVVVWARFQAEIDGLCAALGHHPYVEYHGRVSTEDKNAAIDTFQSGEAKVFIGNQASGSMGITLTKACYMIFMSNDFSLDHRLQAEPRIHRIGQKNVCTYIDVRAKGSVDMRVVERLLENFDLATKLTGDEVMKWIS